MTISKPTITGAETINAVVASYPQTLEVFQRFGLDACCGGSLPLHVAVEHHKLDLTTVLAALRSMVEQDRL